MATPIYQTFGELDLTFIGSDMMSEAWWDKKSGGRYDGAFYNPNFDQLGSDYDDFYFLGSYGMSSYSTPTGPMLLVRDLANPSNPALKLADDFTLIWTDKGSGASQDGSFWLPTCNDSNYKALGTVCVRDHSKPDPKTMRVVLVRKDLVDSGAIGAFVWDDEKTGADKDFGAWAIQIDSVYVDSSNILIAPGCFVGVASHTQPTSASNANVLKLPVPKMNNENPFYPRLDSANQPDQYTSADVTDTVTVPFTAIKDRGMSIDQQIASSPFYTILREEVYELAYFNVNATSSSHAVSVTEATGVSTTDSDTFSANVGVSVTVEGGVNFLGSGGGASATVSAELGYSTSTEIEEFRQVTITNEYTIGAMEAFAVWTKFDQITLLRMDGTAVARSLSFRENSWAESHYPLTEQTLAARR